MSRRQAGNPEDGVGSFADEVAGLGNEASGGLDEFAAAGAADAAADAAAQDGMDDVDGEGVPESEELKERRKRKDLRRTELAYQTPPIQATPLTAAPLPVTRRVYLAPGLRVTRPRRTQLRRHF